jgi:hypothetical protein
MKERPILFSAPMVRALLDGSKTQTRRIVKPQPTSGEWPLLDIALDMRGNRVGAAVWWIDENKQHNGETLCPYGQPGDRLWVRETHCPRYFDNGAPGYKADWHDGLKGIVPAPRWTPSIHMRREYSRILLEVTGVRVERLREISEFDAKDEGCTPSLVGGDLEHLKYRAGYQTLWEAINGAGSWETNPWVWVVEFQKLPSDRPSEENHE